MAAWISLCTGRHKVRRLQKNVKALPTFNHTPFTSFAGDCFCQSKDVCCSWAEIRNRLSGHRHCPVPQQRGRVYFCQTTNQWAFSDRGYCQFRTSVLTHHVSIFYHQTGSLPSVFNFRLIQADFFSLSVGWDQPSSPVQGYRLTYGPRGQAPSPWLILSVCQIVSCLSPALLHVVHLGFKKHYIIQEMNRICCLVYIIL